MAFLDRIFRGRSPALCYQHDLEPDNWNLTSCPQCHASNRFQSLKRLWYHGQVILPHIRTVPKQYQLRIVAVACLVLLQRALLVFHAHQLSLFQRQLLQSDSASREMLLLLLIRISQYLAESLEAFWWNTVKDWLRKKISSAAFEHQLMLGESFHSANSVSGISAAVIKSRAVGKFAEELAFGLLPTFVDVAIVMIYACRFSFLAVVGIGVIGLSYIGLTLISVRVILPVEKKQEKSKGKTAEVTHHLTRVRESIQNMQYESGATEIHKKAMDIETTLLEKAGRLRAIFGLIQPSMLDVCLCFLMMMVTRESSQETLEFFNRLLLMGKQFGTLGERIRRLINSVVKIEKTSNLLHEELEVQDGESATDFDQCTGHLSFHGVEFSYEKKSVLRLTEINFRPGHISAIVGSSGGGKSTFFKLVNREIEAQRGSICVDGINIKTKSVRSLRSNVCVVPQAPKLIAATIIENLRIPRAKLTDDEIHQHCRDLGFHAVFQRIGYEADIGEGGSKLSGGQNMMVALAAAKIKDCRILLLDEVTSPLDPTTENHLLKALDNLKSTTTIITITYVLTPGVPPIETEESHSHRESTVEGADVVWMLRNGNLEGGRSHQDFLLKDVEYLEYWKQQRQR